MIVSDFFCFGGLDAQSESRKKKVGRGHGAESTEQR